MDIIVLNVSSRDGFKVSSILLCLSYKSEYFLRTLNDKCNRIGETIATNSERFDSELWAEIVYNYATAFKNVNGESEKYKLLDSLKTLWIGRFVSYAIEAKDMDMNEAEKIIQRQAEVFEDKFDYLRSIY